MSNSLAELLIELDTLSDIMTDLGVEREDRIFFGLSSQLDELIEKYNLEIIAQRKREQDFINLVNSNDGC